MMTQKQKIIEALAHFLTDNVGGKSILLQMESVRPEGDIRPKLAVEWAALCKAVGCRDHYDFEKMKRHLEKELL